MLYGSKKEFSDIDVFLISDSLPEIYSWLDIRVYKKEDFEKKLRLFDIAVTNPIMTGIFLFGDLNYFEKAKQRFLYQPITEEAIRYNLKERENQKNLANYYPENSEERKLGLSYYTTYLATSLALKNRKRIFDKKELISYLQKQAPVEGEKPPQMKGGKI